MIGFCSRETADPSARLAASLEATRRPAPKGREACRRNVARFVYKYVLIKGAAGLIGTGLREHFAGRYKLRLTDVRTPPALGEDEEFVEVDLRDSGAVQGVVEGVDAVVHLGGIASEDTWEAIRDVNIDGTYDVFESARRSRVMRVVYASSVHTVGF